MRTERLPPTKPPCLEATNSVADLLAGLPSRISDVVESWAERMPDHPALKEASGTWTYRQLSAAVSDAERWLVESGVGPGDRVMLVGENCRAFVAILLAVAATRCVASAGQCASLGTRTG